jgi:hypothetical protein
MAIRIPWDIREAAILLQALINVLNNKKRKKACHSRGVTNIAKTCR